MTKRKRGRPKKSNFYHTRWNRVQLNEQRAAEILGVTVADIERYDLEGNDLAERFLLLWDRKHINAEGWHGWIFSRGRLMFRGDQWRPEGIIADRHFRQSLESETHQILRSLTIK